MKPSRRTRDDPDAALEAAGARSINSLACDLYRVLGRTPGNLTFSPLSISATMGLAYAGASGGTRSEMRSVLHLPPENTQVVEGYRSLFGHVDERARTDDGRWTSANSMWVQDDEPLLPDFVRTLGDYFRSDVGALDFRDAPEAARTTMNEWVESKTDGRIRGLFSQGSIDTAMRLVLATAVHFKGQWAALFEEGATRAEPFHLNACTDTRTRMMFQVHGFGLAHIEGGRVLELPYRGERLSLLVVLPNEVEGLVSLEARLDADTLRAWASALRDREVHVGLPRVTLTSQFALSPTLAALGMPSAFDERVANFSGMTGKRGYFIGLVIHKAFLEMNEEGTEAAAANAMTTKSRCESFIADRPFLFLVRDRASGCLLFMGRVADPTL